MARLNLEICVDNAAALKAAKAAGALRVELCAALGQGGLTPTHGLMRLAKNLSMPAHVMIRPREGDFCYSDDDASIMLDDIAHVKREGLQGVVFGATHVDGALDVSLLTKLLAAAEGLDTTLHRAFDVTPDPFAALEQAIDLGFDRILTSGHAKTVAQGRELILQLIERAAGRIEIMPGSGINATNVAQLVRGMNIKTVHASCSALVGQNPQSVYDLGFADAQGCAQTDQDLAVKLLSQLEIVEGEAA